MRAPFQNDKNHSTKVKRLNELFSDSPKCYYCGCVTKRYSQVWTKGNPIPDDMATIEHLYPKWDIRRPLVGFRESTVLSCYKCNHSQMRNWHLQHQGPEGKVNIRGMLKAQSK